MTSASEAFRNAAGLSWDDVPAAPMSLPSLPECRPRQPYVMCVMCGSTESLTLVEGQFVCRREEDCQPDPRCPSCDRKMRWFGLDDDIGWECSIHGPVVGPV